MCLEPPENDLLSRVTCERSAWSIGACCFGHLSLVSSSHSVPCRCELPFFFSLKRTFRYAHRSFWYLQRNGVPFSSLVLKFGDYSAMLTSDLLHEAQSVYFTLTVMQWVRRLFSYRLPFCFKFIRFPCSPYSRRARADRVSSSSSRGASTALQYPPPYARCSLPSFSPVPVLYVLFLTVFPFFAKSTRI